ncbi:MAG: hypothetical protein JRJ38_01245 [Deltaproteobacteria bacterium]|nr:hypothetical protein [Deltaproteobacteria bacterium]
MMAGKSKIEACPPPACHRQVHVVGSMPACVAMAGRSPWLRAIFGR